MTSLQNSKKKAVSGKPTYSVIYVASVRKELEELSKEVLPRVVARVYELASNPYDRVEKLRGSKRHYRARVGDYRIIYTIQSQVVTITVIKVGHRREVYLLR